MAGRERIYLDRFWDELSADPEGDRRGDARSIMPRSMRGRTPSMTRSSSSRRSRRTPSTTRRCCAKGKLTMPVLAIGAEKSYGAKMADDLRSGRDQCHGGIIPNSGHWIMEEQPAATTKLIVDYLSK